MQSTRTLQPGEETPDGEPKRYLNDAGYARLRWLVGPQQYVEVYEHRLVAGLPPAEMDVHHRNRVRDDNRPENLVVLTRSEHALLHQREDAEKYAAALSARGGHRSAEAQRKAQRAERRRSAIRLRAEKMRTLYESGMTTTELGEMFGLDASNVSIHLRRIGTVMRPFSRWA